MKPWFMSQWVDRLRDLTPTAVSVRFDDEEAVRIERTIRNLVTHLPGHLFSEVDYLIIDRELITKIIEKYSLKPIIEKCRRSLEESGILRFFSVFVPRFEHCSPKDVASMLYEDIDLKVPGIVVHPYMNAYGFHIDAIDAGIILMLFSLRVLIMDNEDGYERFRYIHLRPFKPSLDPEWRLFYIDNRLVGISQYYTTLGNTVISLPYTEEQVKTIARRLIETGEKIRKVLALGDYTIDIAGTTYPIYCGNHVRYRPFLVLDINPLYLEPKNNEETYLGLFTKHELEQNYREGRVEMRYIEKGSVTTISPT